MHVARLPRFTACVAEIALAVAAAVLLLGGLLCCTSEQLRAADGDVRAAEPALHAAATGATALGHPEVGAAIEGGLKAWHLIAAAWGAREGQRAMKRRRKRRTKSKGSS